MSEYMRKIKGGQSIVVTSFPHLMCVFNRLLAGKALMILYET
jgi:hypothetical protein